MTELVTTQPQTSLNVLLIGDSCTDQYNIGTVTRLSPEAPVPIMKIVESYSVPGMAANVYLNLKNLGIDADFIHNDSTITKTRFIEKRSGQHLLRVDAEDDVVRWSGRTILPISSYDAIVISDYSKGFLDYEDIEKIVSEATCPIFIDTKKTRLSDISPPFKSDNIYIKINELEFNNAVSLSDNLIVTLGDKGARFKGDIFPTNPVEVMDVCGCGDTFLAALSYQYLMTKSIEDAIIFANKAASITVQHRGNYAPTLEEINEI